MKIKYAFALLAAFAFATCHAQAPAKPLTCALTPPRNSPADKVYASGDSAVAEVLFNTQVSSAPSAANYAGLVLAQLDQDKVSEALASAQAAVAAMPTQANAQALLGDALTRAGEIPEAAESYNKALALDRCSAAAHFGISRLYDLTGRHLTASKEITFAHKLAPADPAITAAYLQILPPDQRTAALKTLLDAHPALPPTELTRLNEQFAALTQHLGCTTESEFSTERLGLMPVYQNGRDIRSWGLQLSIEGNALPLLELDTTVDGIILNATDAAKAHVRPLTGTVPSGDQPYKAVAGEVKIGKLSFRGCVVTVVPNRIVDNRNSLIGASFFRDHVLHLDYVAKTLTLTPLPTPLTGPGTLTDQAIPADEKNWSPVYIAGPAVLMPTLINKKGPYLFAIDTGSIYSIFSPAVTRKELSTSLDTSLNIQGYSGSIVKVIPRDGGGFTLEQIADVHGPTGQLLRVDRPVKLPVLRFTNNENEDRSVVTFDLNPFSHAAGVEVSALLGFELLSYYGIELNYRDGLARVVFDQNRRYHVQDRDRTNYSAY